MTSPESIRKTRAKSTTGVSPTSSSGVHPAALAPSGTALAKLKASPSSPLKTAAKPKLVRDSFTIPKAEYAVLEALKLRTAKLARPSKKSEVLRAGIVALSAMSDKALLSALNAVPSLKTGRPSGVSTDTAPKTAPKR